MAPNKKRREGFHVGTQRGLHLGAKSQQAGTVGGAYAWHAEWILKASW